MAFHLLVDPRTLAALRYFLLSHAQIRRALDYGDLVLHAGRDSAGTLIVTPELLPPDTSSLRDVMQQTGAPLIFATHLTQRTAHAVIAHTRLGAHSLMILPYNDPGHIVRVATEPSNHELARQFLAGIAEPFSRLPNGLGSALILALHSSLQLTSVKTLAAFCQVSPRSIERWCRPTGLSAKQLVTCVRFVRARAACDRQLPPHHVSVYGGYSQPRALWRAVRIKLCMTPRTFRTIAPTHLIVRLLELLRSNAVSC